MRPSKKTRPVPEPSADNDGRSASLFFNALPFSYPSKTIQAIFGTEPSEVNLRLLPSQVPASITLNLAHTLLPPYYYVSFHSGQTGNTVPVELETNPEIARAWCIHHIGEVLAPQVEYCQHQHSEIPEFWWKAFPLPADGEPTDKPEQWNTFHRFTLRVAHEPYSGRPELLIGYNGAAHIMQHSLDAFNARGTDTRKFSLVTWRKQIYHWKKLPVKAFYCPKNVFPVLNSNLADELGIDFPIHHSPGYYCDAFRLINAFIQTFCLSKEFREVVPHSGKFRAVIPGDTGLLPGASRKLLFGQGGTHTDPLEGIRKFGPLRRPRGKHFRCFFIYFEQNQHEAERLHRYLTGMEGSVRLSQLTCLPLSYATDKNIVIGPGNEPEAWVEHCLQQIKFDPQVIYFAFYIIPWPKEEQDEVKIRLYYRINELLMHWQVSAQALEARTLNNDFSMAVCTIACALVAKLGGKPWRPEGNWQNDPVVGFSSPHRNGPEVSQHDAAVYFAPGGSYGGATLYPAGDSRSVAGLALTAYKECLEKHPGMQRLVIHFHRQFKDDEMNLLQKMLGELQFNIPVVIAAIHRNQSRDLLVLGNPQNGIMPPDGTWTRIGDNSYLLNVNGHSKDGEQELPLFINFRCTRPSHLGEAGVVTELLDQVYGFTRMDWHPANASSLPVTLTYPDRLVSFLPWFRSKMLPVHGECVPWFL